MFKSLKQLLQEAKNINLSEDEKSLIRRELQMHVRKDQMLRQYIYGSKLKLTKLTKLTLIKPMPIFIVILLALGGTSFAAEKTLPGAAKTSRFCSRAKLAVISAPLFSGASITRTPTLRPDIILFL